MPGVPATIPCVRQSVSLFFFLCPQFGAANPSSQKKAKKKMNDGDQNSVLRITTSLSMTIYYFTKAYRVRMLMQVAVLYSQPPTSDRVFHTPHELTSYERPFYLRVMSMRDTPGMTMCWFRSSRSHRMRRSFLV